MKNIITSIIIPFIAIAYLYYIGNIEALITGFVVYILYLLYVAHERIQYLTKETESSHIRINSLAEKIKKLERK